MADATAPPARQEDALELPRVAARERPLVAAGASLGPLLAWGAFAAALGMFLRFGSVRVEAGNWDGRRMRVSQIWDRFLDFLAGQGATPAAIAVVTAATILSLIGGLILVWLAMRLRDQTAALQPDDSSGP